MMTFLKYRMILLNVEFDYRVLSVVQVKISGRTTFGEGPERVSWD